MLTGFLFRFLYSVILFVSEKISKTHLNQPMVVLQFFSPFSRTEQNGIQINLAVPELSWSPWFDAENRGASRI